MEKKRDIQWYPGHMAKAIRQIREQLKLVDLVIEVLDARIPRSSGNPEMDGIAQGKLRLIVLAKSDLSCPDVTRQWIKSYEHAGICAVAVDARSKKDIQTVVSRIMQLAEEKKERDARRGIRFRPVRALVAGIPNVGKSTLINSLSSRAVAKTGNKPGVTKGQQWIKSKRGYELLDTPGLLWPKFSDPIVGEHLAMIGTMPDDLELMPAQEMAEHIIRYGLEAWPETLSEQYGIVPTMNVQEMLDAVAQSIHAVKSGGESDHDKAARVLIDRFRKGQLGKVSLEECE